MKAKRLLSLLLMGAVTITAGALAACQKDNGGNNGDNGDNGGGGSANYTIDETEYYVVGSGEGTLSKTSWEPTDTSLPLVRDESADHNVFTIQLELYVGDEFKIVHDGSWDGEININKLEGLDDEKNVKDAEGNIVFSECGQFGGNIGVQAGQDGKYTFSLHTYPDGEKDTYLSFVKDEALDPLPPKMDMYVAWDTNDFNDMQSKQEESHLTQNGNIWKLILEVTEKDLCRDADGKLVEEGGEYVAVGVINSVDGVVYCDANRTPEPVFINEDEYNLLGVGTYTLKFDSDKNELTIINGIPKVYFCGTMTDWNLNEDYLLEEGNDGIWRGTLVVEESAKLKIRDNADGWYSPTGNDIELTAGEWLFTYNPENNEVKYEKLDYYIAGTLFGEDGKAINFSIVAASPKLTLGEDGLYTVDLVVTDVTETSDYSWIKSQGKDGIFGFQVVYGSVLGGVKDWHNKAEESELYSVDGNVFIREAGTYTITYDPATETISVAVKAA